MYPSLLKKKVGVSEYALGTNLTMIRVITAIWPEEEFEDQHKEALDRWNVYKEGHIGNESGSNMPTPREAQNPRMFTCTEEMVAENA